MKPLEIIQLLIVTTMLLFVVAMSMVFYNSDKRRDEQIDEINRVIASRQACVEAIEESHQ